MKNLIAGLVGLIVLGVSQPVFAYKAYCEYFPTQGNSDGFVSVLFKTQKDSRTIATEFLKHLYSKRLINHDGSYHCTTDKEPLYDQNNRYQISIEESHKRLINYRNAYSLPTKIIDWRPGSTAKPGKLSSSQSVRLRLERPNHLR